jgi:hypothetical protein
MNIELNIVYGTMIGLLVIYLYYTTQVRNEENLNILSKQKEDLLFPKPIKTIEFNHKDMINFLFSIQDFYQNNPQAYEDMIENIDQFFVLYNEIIINPELANQNYQNLVDLKRSILNSLQSIIINLLPNVQRDNKLQESVVVLNNILNKYLSDIKKLHENLIYKNGYNMRTTLINTGPDSYNTFDNSEFSYDIF